MRISREDKKRNEEEANRQRQLLTRIWKRQAAFFGHVISHGNRKTETCRDKDKFGREERLRKAK